MNQAPTKVLSAMTGAALILGGGASFAASLVTSDEALADETAATASASSGSVPQGVESVRNVQGEFSYSQEAITPNSAIKSVFQKASVALCNAASELTVAQSDEWEISVTGDVAQEYTATLGELAQDSERQTIMGCSCVSNTAGGPAAINAEVTGVPLAYMIERAAPDADANTVTLVSEDSYRTSLPLWYVMQRDALITYQVNGEELSESVGGANQMWIDSTAAKYFTRNVVEIAISHEESVPDAPGEEAAAEGEYVNRPNVGILSVE